jgi:hypothetical protein
MYKISRQFWLLLAAYPPIHLAASNTDPISWGQIAVAVGACVALGATTRLFLFGCGLRDSRAEWLTAVFVLGTLLFGHGVTVVSGTWADRGLFLLPCWTALMAIATVFILRRDPPSEKSTRIVAIGTVVLLLLPVGMLGMRESRPQDPLPSFSLLPIPPEHPTPDIVVIVLDRYAGLHGLKIGWGIDNTAFYNALSQRGFFVDADARANYPTTAHAFASMLHMDYLALQSVRPDSRGALRARIARNPVEATLADAGYHIIHGGTQFGVATGSEYANEILTPHPLSEYHRTLYELTVFHRVATGIGIERKRERLWAFERSKLLNIPSLLDGDQPSFVFAHSMIPHWPFLFEADGSHNSSAWDRHDDYPDQVSAANRLVLATVDTLLKRPNPPVILLLSEEGPHPPSFDKRVRRLAWGEASREEICIKFNIFSALRIPGRPTVKAPGSPVNAFRVLFSEVFGVPLNRLPDRSFLFHDKSDYYSLIEVEDPLAAGRDPR